MTVLYVVSPLPFARQLGLIDTLYVEGGRPDPVNDLDDLHNDAEIDLDAALPQEEAATVPLKTKKTRKSKQLAMQPFSYVIAVDFEATCWEKQAPPQWREAEIIGEQRGTPLFRLISLIIP